MSKTLEFHLGERVRALNDNDINQDGTCVAYVMARDQRVRDNYALYEAQRQALDLKLPLLVIFCLQPSTGVRAREHYQFMLDGLQQVEKDLAAKQIAFHLEVGTPSVRLPKALAVFTPAAIYFDFSPLRGPMKLHRDIAKAAKKAPVLEVDAHNIVPVWVASDKQETAARTHRTKVMQRLSEWIDQPSAIQKHTPQSNQKVQSFNDMQTQIDKLLKQVVANGSDTSAFTPGESAAKRALRSFVDQRLKGYADDRNDPTVKGQSELNPYFHYGQLYSGAAVTAVEAAAQKDTSLRQGANAFIEETVVRKELSDNYCFYNSNYDKLSGAPDWGQKTIAQHKDDTRDFTYSRQQFDDAQTHDDAWNAAQQQLRQTGKIHGYMRMYWAKKVLEWSNTPEGALQTLLYLNDHYHLDGGDPNGYVGILWSIAGLHDRPWFERPVYGQVRYMNANGLKRKFKIDEYIDAYVEQRQS